MDSPKDVNLPFFAYGIFKPGQLGFFQLREFVEETRDAVECPGTLLLRDGLPIIDPDEAGNVRGALLIFHSERAEEAYSRIAGMEPDKQYRWQLTTVANTRSNVLVGRSPKKGSVPPEVLEWDGWKDPLFTDALEVVQETLGAEKKFEPELISDLKPLFRLQMAYLLLWSAIERYLALRYNLGDEVWQKVIQLAKEPPFAMALRTHVQEGRHVYRADRVDKVDLDPTKPERALAYYYQVRSNITHRGKAVFRDYKHVRESLAELLPIFRELLDAARTDAR